MLFLVLNIEILKLKINQYFINKRKNKLKAKKIEF